jgi:subtilisin family serine protease
LLRLKKSVSSATANASNSLDRLHSKHHVQAATPVFRTDEDERQARGSAASATLAQLKAHEQTSLQASQASAAARSLRVPQGAAAPSLVHVYRLDLPATADVEAVAEEFRRDPHVEYAQPNYEVHALFTPNDPYYASSNSWGQGYRDLWGLQKMQMSTAWDKTQGLGIVVAVVDTGVDYNHPDLRTNIWANTDEIAGNGQDDDANGFIDDTRGWDFANDEKDPNDDLGHGTHVAGTIAAIGNNNLGIIGVAPKAKIMPLKGLDQFGSGFSDDLAAGIVYAARNGADVINNSWGCSFCPSDPVAEDAVRIAYNLGAVVVFAAGNSKDDVINISPQNMTNPKPIVVGASTQTDTLASFSNFGWLVDVAAPGGGVNTPPPAFAPDRNILSLKSAVCDPGMCHPSLLVGTQYVRQSGTSMSAPHAAGVAALVVAHRPTYTADEIRYALIASADNFGPAGRDLLTAFGRLNADQALQTTPRVLLHSTSFQVSDAVTGNNDGLANPGEIIAVSVSVKNAWIAATNVQAIITSSDPNIIVTQGIALLGAMSSGQTKSASFRFQVSSSAPELHLISLQLQLTASGTVNRVEQLQNIEEVIKPVNAPPPVQAGWPVSFIAGQSVPPPSPDFAIPAIPSEPVFSDVDNNGQLEVVIYAGRDLSGDGLMRVHNKQGALLPGWPKMQVGYRSGHPSVHDLDHNSDLEMTAHFKPFHHTGSAVPGWPKRLAGCSVPFSSKPLELELTNIADLNHDGQAEVIGMWTYPFRDLSTPPDPCLPGVQIHIWNAQGQLLPNMPIRAPSLAAEPSYTDYLVAPALGDLDGDGDFELVTVGGVAVGTAVRVYAWHHTGSPVAGFPKTIEPEGSPLWYHGTPSLGDLDHDGKDEIIVTLSGFEGQGGKIHVLRGNGGSVSGWPQTLPSKAGSGGIFLTQTDPSSSLGDIDGDGKLEIVVTVSDFGVAQDAERIYAFNENGTPVTGWPKDIAGFHLQLGGGSLLGDTLEAGWAQPIIADVSGDGKPDVVLPLVHWSPAHRQDTFVRIFAWSGNGTLVPGFPFNIADRFATSISAGDIDGDGDIELGVVAATNVDDFAVHQNTITVRLWDLAVPFNPQAAAWPMYGHDAQRTSRHGTPGAPPASQVDLRLTALSGPAAVVTGGSMSIAQTVKNFGAAAAGSFSIGLYLSTDATITTADRLLGTRTVTALAAGASQSVTTTVTVPSLAAGTYTLGAIADHTNQVQETTETNNSRAGNMVTVRGPDLLVTAISGPASAPAGQLQTFNLSFRNGGNAAAGPFDVGIYLSSDQTITTADTLLGEWFLSALGAGTTGSSGAMLLTVPASLAPGTYYVGALADHESQVVETNETNNAKAGNVVTVTKPDLVVTAISGPTSAARGSLKTFNLSFKNQGTGTASALDVGIYLSTDQTITTADTRIGAWFEATLAAGATKSGAISLQIPSTLTPRTYYVGAIADYKKVVIESNEGNNTKVGNAITIQ